jgi:hypothetical protein
LITLNRVIEVSPHLAIIQNLVFFQRILLIYINIKNLTNARYDTKESGTCENGKEEYEKENISVH